MGWGTHSLRSQIPDKAPYSHNKVQQICLPWTLTKKVQQICLPLTLTKTLVQAKMQPLAMTKSQNERLGHKCPSTQQARTQPGNPKVDIHWVISVVEVQRQLNSNCCVSYISEVILHSSRSVNWTIKGETTCKSTARTSTLRTVSTFPPFTEY